MKKAAIDNTSQFATKQDLRELEGRMDDRFSALGQRIDNQSETIAQNVTRAVIDEIVPIINDFVAHFDERFARIEFRLANLEARMDRVEERLDKIEADIARLYDYVDKVAKQQEIDEQERLIMGHQLSRLERWVQQLAERAGVTLVA